MSPPLSTISSLPDPIIELLTTYNELNSDTIDELHELPSALEFMRYVSQNRPFVVRGGAKDWAAVKTWNIKTLKQALEGENVNVAITPHGNADSPTSNEKGELCFVTPLEEKYPFSTLIDYIATQELSGRLPNDEVQYAQPQDDSLRKEYISLFGHVKSDIDFATIALQKEPEAINFWLGNSHSITALHSDNYENIYVQVIGQKHFVLLSPLFYPVVKERELQPGTYVRTTPHGKLKLQTVEGNPVPFPTWDPDDGGYDDDLVRPMRVTLGEGDMLYLPKMWYHKVSQSCGEEGVCCAVNYWYDMEFEGSLWPLCQLVKRLGLDAADKEQEG